MDHLFHLVEVYGHRITNSPGFNASARWAASRLEEWGAENVRLERWGPFGQGWSRSHFSAHLVEPQYEMLIGVPLGWSPGTDHLSFDAVGLPGIQFIQHPVEYETRTHHSNMDAYDRAQPSDLMQVVVVIASFVYLAANREEKLPRKPLPDPLPTLP